MEGRIEERQKQGKKEKKIPSIKTKSRILKPGRKEDYSNHKSIKKIVVFLFHFRTPFSFQFSLSSRKHETLKNTIFTDYSFQEEPNPTPSPPPIPTSSNMKSFTFQSLHYLCSLSGKKKKIPTHLFHCLCKLNTPPPPFILFILFHYQWGRVLPRRY